MAWKLTSSAFFSYTSCKYWFTTKVVIVHVNYILFPEQNKKSIEDPSEGGLLWGCMIALSLSFST